MKKIVAYLSAFILIIVGTLSLSSCSKKSFYSEWNKAGANIEKDNMFEMITVDEIESKLGNKEESFAVFFGSSNDSQSVKDVSAMQYTADVKNYEGKVYFLTTTKLKTQSKMKEIKEKIKVDISDMDASVQCVLFEKGKVEFNTSKKDSDEVKKFKIDEEISIIAVLEYVIEYYPVK
jgi:hypothetical protein